MKEQKYYLGIDGGGTKTKFVIADGAGKILASYVAGPSFYIQVGLDKVTEVMKEGTDGVIAELNALREGQSEAGQGCAMEQVTKEDISYACAGCAGYGDVAADDPRIEEAVKKGLGGIPVRVVNDCEIALAGALEGEEGICLIAGTGSIGYGYSKERGTMRCGGWNHVLGSDEGSGYWLGWSLLREFGHQSDGRSGKTLLYEKMKEVLGLSTDDEMITRVVEEWKLDRTKIASLALPAEELYDAGDPFAKDLVERAAAELAAMAVALYGRLGFAGRGAEESQKAAIPVSGAGSIFKMGGRLKEPLTGILEQQGMTWREPALTPEEGAVILAMREE